jgi:hypothetical protein
MEKNLKIAGIAGIIYLVASIPEMILELFRQADELTGILVTVYVIISVAIIISTIFFYRGFILIGGRLHNHLLVISAYIVILSTILIYGYDIYSLSYYAVERDLVGIGAAILYGFVGIFFGVGLMGLRDNFGGIATAAGILEIVAGVTFVVVVLFFIGLVLLIPAIILEVLILYRAAENPEERLQRDYGV